MSQGDPASGAAGEFSRPFNLRELGERPVRREVEADAHERAALAERFGLIGLERLVGELTLRRLRGGSVVRVTGRLSAAATQRCVVTLGPVPAVLDEGFELDFQPAGGQDAAEVVLDAEVDEPEPLEGDRLDLGELVAQQFALALDPYPRAPGAELVQRDWGASDEEEVPSDNPFAALASLKDRGQR
ncbi:Uncharacterized metal-binding protein YceD, DUF177 family [Tistlia consotensis]|uniref:Uncharacterized metal-binding protein YceD, DUF177 family n=1 Tax=Tistlia consotensis USBA 355 TaxID=560819 RepID=A0A1Y6C391_9PROT|nr:DUF177 domain-containing protein [Tistlia consotensis]SMF43411.1 Uncharacterized metal-binding protein YceD, DUF177 family [Tistlia consotensis USBA 355]SNR42513.1 Uncharacterized metal-binding protein YceD, DUF177 family [Tistlia consotensis]